ncbi:hypothetical protein FRC00_002622 [Tulasnella sp. 408]|nr:hypothetical protein FRC00_002622 [Tulasnella sp. 408]
MKLSVIALFAAPALVLGSLAPQDGPAAVARHHHNVARGVKAHPASRFSHSKRGPAKAKRCAAKTASLASVSSTSVLAEKTTTTTKKEEPTTTTTKKEEEHTTTTRRTTTTHRTTTTTSKPKPTADSNDDDNSGSSGGQTYTGDGTFYSTGLNACGTWDKDTDYICAIAHADFDSYPGANGNSNENPICNKKVNACWQGKCVTCRITDRCGGCQPHALDFSPSAFKELADFDVGRLHGMTWHYL